MERKFLIFVAIVSVTLNCVLQSSATLVEFSDETIDNLNRIDLEYYDALSNISCGIDSYIKTIENLTVQANIKKSPSYNDIVAELNKAFVQVETALNLTFESALLTVGNCNAIGSAQVASIPILREGFSVLINSVDWAYSGESSGNPNGIEGYRNAAQVGFQPVTRNLFNSIRSCIGKASKQVTVEIQGTEDAVRYRFDQIIDAVMNITQTYGNAVVGAELTNDTAALALISSNRRTAAFAGISACQSVFSLYRAIYFQSELQGKEIVDQIYVIELAQKMEAYSLAEMTKVVFVAIDNLYRYSETIEDHNACDIFLYNTTKAGAIAALESAHENYLVSVAYLQPYSADVAAARAISDLFMSRQVEDYYAGISLAVDESLDSTSRQLAINAVQEMQSLTSDYMVTADFKLISNVSDQIEPVIARLLQKAKESINNANFNTFEAIRMLAKTRSASVAPSQDDHLAIQALRQEAIISFNDFSKYLANAHLIKVIAGKGY